MVIDAIQIVQKLSAFPPHWVIVIGALGPQCSLSIIVALPLSQSAPSRSEPVSSISLSAQWGTPIRISANPTYCISLKLSQMVFVLMPDSPAFYLGLVQSCLFLTSLSCSCPGKLLFLPFDQFSTYYQLPEFFMSFDIFISEDYQPVELFEPKLFF